MAKCRLLWAFVGKVIPGGGNLLKTMCALWYLWVGGVVCRERGSSMHGGYCSPCPYGRKVAVRRKSGKLVDLPCVVYDNLSQHSREHDISMPPAPQLPSVILFFWPKRHHLVDNTTPKIKTTSLIFSTSPSHTPSPLPLFRPSQNQPHNLFPTWHASINIWFYNSKHATMNFTPLPRSNIDPYIPTTTTYNLFSILTTPHWTHPSPLWPYRLASIALL